MLGNLSTKKKTQFSRTDEEICVLSAHVLLLTPTLHAGLT